MNLNKIKSFVCALMLPMVTFAAEDNVCLRFSTQGPDRYLDGNAVVDGEVYALVASKDGEFKGFNANGTVIDSGNDYVAVLAPVAKDGRCPPTWFQVRKENKRIPSWAYTEGKWGVFLLDTRLVDGTIDPNRMGQVNGYGLVGDMVALGVVGEVASAKATITEGTLPKLRVVEAKVIQGEGDVRWFQIAVEGVPPGGACTVTECESSEVKSDVESKVESSRMVLRFPVKKPCEIVQVDPDDKGNSVKESKEGEIEK